MGRTLIALLATAAVVMPVAGYAGAQFFLGPALNQDRTQTASFVAPAAEAPELKPVAPALAAKPVAAAIAAEPASGIGLPPTKRVVETIVIAQDDTIGDLIVAGDEPETPVAAEPEPVPLPVIVDNAPLPRPYAEALKARGEGTQQAALVVDSGREPPPADTAQAGCLNWQDLTDRDGDFKRNGKALEGANFCISEDKFNENGIDWVVHVIKSGKPGPLWAAPHDNEDAAFDSGIWAMAQYGGTMVSVETGGERNNGSIDPNRNFTGDATACGRHSPRFTALFVDNRGNGRMIGLHSNTPGGDVSVNGKLPNTTPHKAVPKINPFIEAKSGDDTLVFVASLQPDGQDPVVDGIVKRLVENGMNVMREHVTPKSNDCSFSNYAALHQLPDYYNVEVVHGDGNAQRKMIELLMKM